MKQRKKSARLGVCARTMSSCDDECGYRVELFVYDLSRGLAKTMSPALLGKQIEGIWHTGVVAYGREYFFGSAGIESCRPGGTILGDPDRIEELGESQVPYQLFLEYIFGLGESTYRPGAYDLLQHNCNNFSDDIAQFLCGCGVPKAILQLPDEVLNTPLGETLCKITKELQLKNADSRSISFGLLNSSSGVSTVPDVQIDRTPYHDPEFDELNDAIEQVRYNTIILEDRRNSLNQKLSKRERKERKREKRERKERRRLSKSLGEFAEDHKKKTKSPLPAPSPSTSNQNGIGEYNASLCSRLENGYLEDTPEEGILVNGCPEVHQDKRNNTFASNKSNRSLNHQQGNYYIQEVEQVNHHRKDRINSREQEHHGNQIQSQEYQENHIQPRGHQDNNIQTQEHKGKDIQPQKHQNNHIQPGEYQKNHIQLQENQKNHVESREEQDYLENHIELQEEQNHNQENHIDPQEQYNPQGNKVQAQEEQQEHQLVNGVLNHTLQEESSLEQEVDKTDVETSQVCEPPQQDDSSSNDDWAEVDDYWAEINKETELTENTHSEEQRLSDQDVDTVATEVEGVQLNGDTVTTGDGVQLNTDTVVTGEAVQLDTDTVITEGDSVQLNSDTVTTEGEGVRLNTDMEETNGEPPEANGEQPVSEEAPNELPPQSVDETQPAEYSPSAAAEPEPELEREPPILFKEDLDTRNEFASLVESCGQQLNPEEKQHMDELHEYVVEDDGSWALSENFSVLFARVLHDPAVSDAARLHLIRILAAAALKDDVILLLHQDRREHTIMNYANKIEYLSSDLQEALALFFCNMFEHLNPSEWLLYISEWGTEGGQQISNIRVTTKVAVNALLHPDAKVRDYGTALMYNLGTKEVKTVVFDDVAPELAMAILQFFNNNLSEEHIWRTLTALCRFCYASSEVPSLIKMIGPEPSVFKGASERVDIIIEEIDTKLSRVRLL